MQAARARETVALWRMRTDYTTTSCWSIEPNQSAAQEAR